MAKSLFPPSDMNSPESNMRSFRNYKYLSLSLLCNTDSFKKYQILGYHSLLCFPHLFLKVCSCYFFSPRVPCPQSYYPSQEICWTAWEYLKYVFSSSNLVFKRRTTAVTELQFAWSWQSLVLDVPGLKILFSVPGMDLVEHGTWVLILEIGCSQIQAI